MNTSATRLLVFIVVVQLSALALALPARAQLLADAVQEPHLTRESRQRAVAATLAHPGFDLAGQAVTSTSTEWSQVMALAPGTRIIVTVAGEGDRREFVSADESTLTVRNFRERTNVEVLTRRDIVEVYTVVGGGGGAGRTARGAVGCFLGYLGGAFAGGMGGMLFARAAGTDPSNLGPMFFGMIGGGVAGGILGYRAAAGRPAETTTVLIYRAPVRVIP